MAASHLGVPVPLYCACWLNGTEPSSVLLVTPTPFLLCQVKCLPSEGSVVCLRKDVNRLVIYHKALSRHGLQNVSDSHIGVGYVNVP